MVKVNWTHQVEHTVRQLVAMHRRLLCWANGQSQHFGCLQTPWTLTTWLHLDHNNCESLTDTQLKLCWAENWLVKNDANTQDLQQLFTKLTSLTYWTSMDISLKFYFFILRLPLGSFHTNANYSRELFTHIILANSSRERVFTLTRAIR